MLKEFNNLIEQTDELVAALEKYELIPGVTDQSIRSYKSLKDRLSDAIATHVEINTHGLIFVIGKHIDTDYEVGQWEILAGPFDLQSYGNITLFDVDNGHPLIRISNELTNRIYKLDKARDRRAESGAAEARYLQLLNEAIEILAIQDEEQFNFVRELTEDEQYAVVKFRQQFPFEHIWLFKSMPVQEDPEEETEEIEEEI